MSIAMTGIRETEINRTRTDLTEFVALVQESRNRGKALAVDVKTVDASVAVSSFRRAAAQMGVGLRISNTDKKDGYSEVKWMATTKSNRGPLTDEQKAKRATTRAATKAKKEREQKAAAGKK